MGTKEDEERRRRRWAEDEADSHTGGTGEIASADFLAKLDELIRRAEPLLEQVNSLYRQYSTGGEMRPPHERRKQLDQIMASLMMMAKPTVAYRFRYNGLHGTYQTYRERWDKLVKDVESGKIKRTTGPKRG